MAGKRKSNRRSKNPKSIETSPSISKPDELTQMHEEVNKHEEVNNINNQDEGIPNNTNNSNDATFTTTSTDSDSTNDIVEGSSTTYEEGLERNEDEIIEIKMEDVPQNDMIDDREKGQDVEDDVKKDEEQEKEEEENEAEKGESEEDQDEENKDDRDDGCDDEEEDEEEGWDLKHIHTIEEIKSGTMKCMTKRCPLIACTTYVSSINASSIWYSCLDCQEKDYGGWPLEREEIPIKFMTEDHREVISEMCTGRYSPNMPNVPTIDTSMVTSSPAQQITTELNTESTITDTSGKIVGNHVSAVTPPPGKQSKWNKMTTKPTSIMAKKVTPILSKPSNQALAVHKKWQDAATALGGERIVVSKPAAKNLIFELLKDSFKPMNITDIFKSLKGVVPSPVLKSSLDDMALDTFSLEDQFADSDDEDGDSTSKKKKKLNISCDEEYAGSLAIKGGRNANTTLYYCDYSKLSNNGNGLLPYDRNNLLSDHETAKAELQAKVALIQVMTSQTRKLLSEPTNEDATTSLEEIEVYTNTLREKIEAAQEFKSLEKQRIKVKKHIDVMTAEWRKRRRLCMDFLMTMEENTDGTISVKKCLSGDGQIYIESDTDAIKGQKEYAINKKRRGLVGNPRKKQKIDKQSIATMPADENFIGVDLNASGIAERVYLDEL